MPREQMVEVSFGGGQILEAGDLERLPDGYARYLSSWRPTRGILVPRQPWLPGAVTGSPEIIRGRGFYAGFRPRGLRRPMVALWTGSSRFGEEGANLTIYEIPTGGGTDRVVDWNGSLSVIETITMDVSPDAIHYPVIFAAGAEHVVYTNPGFPGVSDVELRPRKWSGSGRSLTTISEDIAGRTVAYHLNRWWLGGAESPFLGPFPGGNSRLRFSEEEDPDTWNVTTNWFPIRSRDGDPIEALCSWEGFLVVGKRDSMHYVYGSGPTTFGVREITDQVGSATGQTAIIPTPRGLAFVGTDGYVYMWNGGGRPRRITQHSLGGAVYPYTLGDDYTVPTDPAALAYIDPLLYAWVPGTRGILVIDLDQDLEWYEQIDDDRGVPYDLTAIDDTLVMTHRETTDDFDSAFSFRSPAYTSSAYTLTTTPRPDRWGSVYRWESGAIIPASLNGRATLKNLYVRFSQWHDGVDGNGFTVRVTSDEGQSVVSQVMGRRSGALDQRQWAWDRWDTSLDGNSFKIEIFSEPTDDTFSDIYSIERCVAKFVGDVEER